MTVVISYALLWLFNFKIHCISLSFSFLCQRPWSFIFVICSRPNTLVPFFGKSVFANLVKIPVVFTKPNPKTSLPPSRPAGHVSRRCFPERRVPAVFTAIFCRLQAQINGEKQGGLRPPDTLVQPKQQRSLKSRGGSMLDYLHNRPHYLALSQMLPLKGNMLNPPRNTSPRGSLLPHHLPCLNYQLIFLRL